jgi:hypothetical protein
MAPPPPPPRLSRPPEPGATRAGGGRRHTAREDGTANTKLARARPNAVSIYYYELSSILLVWYSNGGTQKPTKNASRWQFVNERCKYVCKCCAQRSRKKHTRNKPRPPASKNPKINAQRTAKNTHRRRGGGWRQAAAAHATRKTQGRACTHVARTRITRRAPAPGAGAHRRRSARRVRTYDRPRHFYIYSSRHRPPSSLGSPKAAQADRRDVTRHARSRKSWKTPSAKALCHWRLRGARCRRRCVCCASQLSAVSPQLSVASWSS